MKQIQGYDGKYSINENGQVWSHYRNRFLKPYVNSWGYLTVRLRKNGKQKSRCVHKLLGIEYIPNPENKEQVNHINGDKLDNRLENLEWVTRSENVQHSYDTGLQSEKHGEKSGKSILTEKSVIEIKKLLKLNKTLKYISDKFNVSISAISHIKKGRSWNHIKI